MQIIYLDISNKGVVPTIYAKQGDVGRKVQVVFMDSGIPYEIPENANLSVWYEGDSGNGNYTDIGDKSAIVVENNKVTLELITQMLNNDGEGIVCLVMNVGEDQIGSWNIHYLCEKVPGFDSDGASSYFTAFSESVNKLKDTDKTLTKEGYPADAKATGDKIDNLTAGDVGAAPGGYGWGETKTSYNPPNGDPDNVDRTCVFSVSQGNLPAAGIWRGVAHLNSDVAGQMTIRAFTGSAVGCICTRAKIDGAWQHWEWVNPNLAYGVEYRTTERYNGKPVYTMAINCGTAPNATVKDVSHGATNVESVISYGGHIGAHSLPYEILSGNKCYISIASSTMVRIKSVGDFSTFTITAWIKYTKTTD